MVLLKIGLGIFIIFSLWGTATMMAARALSKRLMRSEEDES
jgi:hypothetical protein